jgi:ribosomal protein S18 acetylase RimI-like enzyme
MNKPADLQILRMAVSDVPDVVRVHLTAFPGFFLSFLGPRFLSLYYEECVKQGEIASVAIIQGQLAGFVMGSAHPAQFYSGLVRRRALRFAAIALPAVIKQPRIALRVARALSKPKDAQRIDGTATLMSLGVAPDRRGQGIGSKLVAAFLAEARARGSSRVDLTTDQAQNEKTNEFYRRMGFVVGREITTPEGRVLNEYAIDLNPLARSPDSVR